MRSGRTNLAGATISEADGLSAKKIGIVISATQRLEDSEREYSANKKTELLVGLSPGKQLGFLTLRSSTLSVIGLSYN